MVQDGFWNLRINYGFITQPGASGCWFRWGKCSAKTGNEQNRSRCSVSATPRDLQVMNRRLKFHKDVNVCSWKIGTGKSWNWFANLCETPKCRVASCGENRHLMKMKNCFQQIWKVLSTVRQKPDMRFGRVVKMKYKGFEPVSSGINVPVVLFHFRKVLKPTQISYEAIECCYKLSVVSYKIEKYIYHSILQRLNNFFKRYKGIFSGIFHVFTHSLHSM